MYIRDKENRALATVNLEDIAGKLEEASDHWEQYLNVVTGEFEALADGMYIETDEELAEEIECSGDYVRLPNQYGIHEYRIMERFAEATLDEKKQTRLFRALHGRRPYRHFKDEINLLGLSEVYYAFRYVAFVEMARDWCEGNGIPYQIDTSEKAR